MKARVDLLWPNKLPFALLVPQLMNIYGIGPARAARILADVGDIARFPDRNHFGSSTGTAPIDASSGEQIRRRLCRAGNRRLNHVLCMAAFVRLRHETEGRAFDLRKPVAGKIPMEAMQCVTRRLSDGLRARHPEARRGVRPRRARQAPQGDSHIQRGRPNPARGAPDQPRPDTHQPRCAAPRQHPHPARPQSPPRSAGGD